MATACKSRSKCDLRHRLGGCLFREQPSPGLAGTAKPLSNQQLGFVNQGTAGKTVPAAVLGCDRLSSGVHRSLRGPPGRGDVLAQPWVPSFQTTREGGGVQPRAGQPPDGSSIMETHVERQTGMFGTCVPRSCGGEFGVRPGLLCPPSGKLPSWKVRG